MLIGLEEGNDAQQLNTSLSSMPNVACAFPIHVNRVIG